MKTTAMRTVMGAAALTLFLFADLPSATAQTQAEPSPIGQMASGLNPANWQMPEWKMPNFRKLLPEKEEKARIVKKKDGLFDEVTKSTSNSWRKTKEALNPKKLNPIRFFPASARTPVPSRQEVSKPKPGFFRSLFSPAPTPENDNDTVTDFLRQSRPSP